MVRPNDIRELARGIVREFRPERIVLFGSHAAGTASADSDVDLLVIMPFRGTALKKSVEILNRLDVRIPVDLVARRPADVRRRYAECDPLIRDALDRGKVLYERHG